MRHVWFAIVFAATILPRAACAQTAAPAPGGPGVSTLTGVYTERQARRGESAYRVYCVRCHDQAAYTGESFARNWATRSAFDLVHLISTTMPNDEPGKLSGKQYVDIVAYLFKLNGLPSGTRDLPDDKPALQQVVIAVKDTTPR